MSHTAADPLKGTTSAVVVETPLVLQATGSGPVAPSGEDHRRKDAEQGVILGLALEFQLDSDPHLKHRILLLGTTQ